MTNNYHENLINEWTEDYWQGQVNRVKPDVANALSLLEHHPDGVQSLVEARDLLTCAVAKLESAFD